MSELGSSKRMKLGEVKAYHDANPQVEIPNSDRGYGVTLKANYLVNFEGEDEIAITTFGKSLESDKNPGQFRQDCFWVILANVTLLNGSILKSDISDATFRQSGSKFPSLEIRVNNTENLSGVELWESHLATLNLSKEDQELNRSLAYRRDTLGRLKSVAGKTLKVKATFEVWVLRNNPDRIEDWGSKRVHWRRSTIVFWTLVANAAKGKKK